jgi:DNA-binding transcriptional MerR regulator
MTQRSTYTISELADAAGTTPRTIRFYTAEGLLPPPDARGRYASYSVEHLDRLRLIDRLKDAYQPLTAIRERLTQLNSEDVRSLIEETERRRDGTSLDDLLVRCAETMRARAAERERPISRARAIAMAGAIPNEKSATSVLEEVAENDGDHDREGDTWHRVMLAPGVELSFRLPVSPQHLGQLEELIQNARRLFETEL